MKSLVPMNRFAPVRRRGVGSRARRAFTMIELLTVIAIIAILAAIIFPVFAQLRENSRRSNTISNMQRIYSAIRQYKLDNRTYPEYLFGPVLDRNGVPVTAAGVSLDQIFSMEEIAAILRAPVPADPAQAVIARNVKREYAESLFPGYINDLRVFSCPNNIDVRISGDKSYAVMDRYVVTGRNTAEPRTVAFYKYDAFDSSPAVTGPDTIDKNTFQPRYSRLWFANGVQNGQVQFYSGAMTGQGSLAELQSSSPDNYAAYSRQMVFNNPSADTFVTMTTYHVPNSKICVLFLNGTAKPLDTRKLNQMPGGDYVAKGANAYRLTPGS